MARITAAERPHPKTEDLGPKVKAHQRYYAADGELLPGVTTVVGELGWNKYVLINWARNEAFAGNDPDLIKAETAAIGTLAHHFIECHLTNQEPNVSDYSSNQIKRATYALQYFHEWRKQHILTPRLVEAQLVSERYRFGGTVDCWGIIDDDLPALLDFKTAKGIWLEHKLQVAAYWWLLKENGYDVKGVRILRIPRVEGEDFEEHVILGPTILTCWQVFKRALEIYRLHKELTRGAY